MFRRRSSLFIRSGIILAIISLLFMLIDISHPETRVSLSVIGFLCLLFGNVIAAIEDIGESLKKETYK